MTGSDTPSEPEPQGPLPPRLPQREADAITGWTDPDAPPRRGPMEAPPDASTLGTKLFLSSLLMLFGATLLGYVVTRVQARHWTDFKIEGLRTSIAVSTVLIVLVSAFLHFAVHSIRYDRRDRLKFGVVIATILALLFLVNQYETWQRMFERLAAEKKSVSVASNPDGDLSVFMFFAMTVIHALHVLGGFVPLGFVIVKSFRDMYSGASYRGVWNCSLYWHFIDGVWILMAIALGVG